MSLPGTLTPRQWCKKSRVLTARNVACAFRKIIGGAIWTPD